MLVNGRQRRRTRRPAPSLFPNAFARGNLLTPPQLGEQLLVHLIVLLAKEHFIGPRGLCLRIDRRHGTSSPGLSRPASTSPNQASLHSVSGTGRSEQLSLAVCESGFRGLLFSMNLRQILGAVKIVRLKDYPPPCAAEGAAWLKCLGKRGRWKHELLNDPICISC